MKIIILGAGQVGGTLAENLVGENNDITLIDTNVERLRELRDSARRHDPAIAELSMGMSNDFEEAILQGADVVRVGEAIFGKRSTPDGHYWPTT